MAAPRTARDRVRAELSQEILRVAREHLARDGAAALSLRSIARDLEMAPSALYRYFDGRDALLTALILEAYGSLADTAERTADRAAGEKDLARWATVLRAMREWALSHPHEWGLIFGSPVPGYQAPEDTVAQYVRLATALVRPVVDAHEAGLLRMGQLGSLPPPAKDWAAALLPVQEGLVPGLPTVAVARIVQAWATVIGSISVEVFGHWHNTVLDPALLYEETVRVTAQSVGLVS